MWKLIELAARKEKAQQWQMADCNQATAYKERKNKIKKHYSTILLHLQWSTQAP